MNEKIRASLPEALETQTCGHNYYNGDGPSSLAVEEFVHELERARAMFGTTHTMDAARVNQWLQFYEERVRLYDALYIALPQVKRIPEFWRTAQHLKGAQLANWISNQVGASVATQCKCGATLTGEGNRCEACARERKIHLTIEARRRREVSIRVRRCHCGGLLQKRHRFCASCARARRRESYRKAKTGSMRQQLTRNFTSEKLLKNQETA